MLRTLCLILVCLALALAPGPAGAQEEEAPTSYVYGIYYECDVNQQWLADKIVKDVFAPGMDAAVEEGKIRSWGWLAHHTGGQWRRLMYFVAATTDGLLDALDGILGKIGEENPEASRQLGEICGSHDDYIWQRSTGSGGPTGAEERGEAGFSVYMQCDMTREERADELVKEVFAPIYNRQVAEGNLVSWGWLQHYVGGKWRRLATMTASDHKALLKARDAVIEELVGSHAEASAEFDAICSAHQDYMWDIQLEKP